MATTRDFMSDRLLGKGGEGAAGVVGRGEEDVGLGTIGRKRDVYVSVGALDADWCVGRRRGRGWVMRNLVPYISM